MTECNNSAKSGYIQVNRDVFHLTSYGLPDMLCELDITSHSITRHPISHKLSNNTNYNAHQLIPIRKEIFQYIVNSEGTIRIDSARYDIIRSLFIVSVAHILTQITDEIIYDASKVLSLRCTEDEISDSMYWLANLVGKFYIEHELLKINPNGIVEIDIEREVVNYCSQYDSLKSSLIVQYMNNMVEKILTYYRELLMTFENKKVP